MDVTFDIAAMLIGLLAIGVTLVIAMISATWFLAHELRGIRDEIHNAVVSIADHDARISCLEEKTSNKRQRA
jgi:hypothetical protein